MKSLSKQFADFRRDFGSPRTKGAPRGNRWNTIGRTRERLAEILTAYVRTIEGNNGEIRFPEGRVLPEDIYPMRLAGKARRWEDAHSWEASATWPNGKCFMMLMSYSTMTAIVRSGRAYCVGKDGEVSA